MQAGRVLNSETARRGDVDVFEHNIRRGRFRQRDNLARVLRVFANNIADQDISDQRRFLRERLRAWILRLTPKGRRAFEAMASEHEQWVLDLFKGLDAKTVQQLYTHLGALRVQLVRSDSSAEDKA